MRLPLCTLIASAMLFLVPTSPAQDSAQPAAVITAQAASVVPHLIKFSGALPSAPGNTSVVDVKFSLYAAQTGGDPLWSETQSVSLDPTGKYSVLLGSVAGLPDSVFAQGQARWIGVTLSGEQESARTILVATPYSLKASDSETLGGHPVSDFALKNALPAGGTDVTQIDGTNGVVVNGSGTGPTVTLGLSSSYLETLGNSIYPQIAATNTLTGKNTYSAGKLFIGTAPVLSTANVLASSPITVAASGNNVTIGLSDSGLLTLGNSVYAQLGAANTFSKIQTFASGQTFPGTVSLSANNSFTGSNTFSKAITFASGQTFPGTGAGTITGITTSSPLSGSGTSGSVALSLNTSSLESTLNGVYPQLSASNTFSGSNTFSKAITFASGQTFPGTGNGTITGVTAGTGLTGGGSSGGVTLNVDVNGLESTYNSVYAGLSADNNFTGQNSIDFGDDGTGLNVEVGNSRSANFYSNSANGFDTVDIISSNANDDLLVAYNSDSGGSCIIDGNGDLSCTGSLAVTNSLGDRKVETYGVQSAENWIEDFGSGQLIAGSSHISLEPTFAATVNTAAEYHVFLTPRGDSEGLYVANAGPDGFDVKESRGGHTTLAFDYRIVARRKGFETVRMRDITAKTKAHQARREELDAAAKRSRPAVTPHVSAKP